MNKFTTICTVGFNGSVSNRQNVSAHGGVKHCQARKTKDGYKGRYVNSNGRFVEIGNSFSLSVEQYNHWKNLGE